MALLAIGLNHVTAPLALRERAAIPPEQLPQALRELCQLGPFEAAALVSTCNRTELYLSGQRDPAPLLHWWQSVRPVDARSLDGALYRHVDEDAVRHVFRVATGLDSMVLGEPQILGQLKDAHRQAREAQTLSPALDRLFQRSFAVAKRIRSETALGESPVSVAYAAVRLLQRLFDELPRRSALLVGAGETIELVGRHLRSRGVHDIVVANRTLERASQLAGRLAARAADLQQLESLLVEADVVFVATHASEPLLRRPAVETAFRKRRHRPMFMADLSVPRNIDPAVGDLPDVYLYALDDLAQVVEEGQDRRRDAALLAETLVSDHVGEFMRWWRAQHAVEAVRALRDHAQNLQQSQLERALALLRSGSPPEEALRQLAQGLTNKLLHQPTVLLREAAAQEDAELLGLVRRLYTPDPTDREP